MSMSDDAKLRIDAWAAQLTEAQRWDVYARMRTQPWHRVAAWCEAEFGIEPPSRSALYRFCTRLRPLERARRVEEAIAARNDAEALAQEVTADEALIGAWKTLAADLAMRGEAEAAALYTRMALQIAEAARRRAELEIKARALAVSEEAGRLAREKFEAQQLRENEARKTISDSELSQEEREARLRAIYGI